MNIYTILSMITVALFSVSCGAAIQSVDFDNSISIQNLSSDGSQVTISHQKNIEKPLNLKTIIKTQRNKRGVIPLLYVKTVKDVVDGR
jgi:hypothetical protein